MTRRALALLVVLMLVLTAGGALAQDAEPSPDSPTRDRAATPEGDEADDDVEDDLDTSEPAAVGDPDVDLAAMALDSDVMPEGYTLSNEYYVDLEALGNDLVARGTLDDIEEFEALNITAYYESYYATTDLSQNIRSYIIAYEDEDDVQAGFDVLEDESVTIPPGGGEWDDEEAPDDIGEQPAEITTAVFEVPTNQQEGVDETLEIVNVDFTFRVDRFHVGVAIEHSDGTDPDLDLVEELGAELEERVLDVLDEEEIENIDLELPSLLPALAGPPPFEGYQTVSEAFPTEQPMDEALEDGFVSSYTRGASFSDDPAAGWPPYLTIRISRFEDEETVLDLLDDPDALQPDFLSVEPEEIDSVEDYPAVAFTFPSPITTEPDSYLVYVGVDDLILEVQVQGTQEIEQAEEEALAIAEDFVACVTDGEDCGPYELPSEIGAPMPTGARSTTRPARQSVAVRRARSTTSRVGTTP
jgi:hypothetical protein